VQKVETEVLTIEDNASFLRACERAAELLSADEVVALPTETVYGLAANAFKQSAVEKIFAIKGRPAFNPLIVHVAERKQAFECASCWPTEAETLANKFWPGPLTLVLPKSERIPKIVTAGGETVGIRWPAHPFMQAVIKRTGFPLAAPSANLSNRISPTTAAHVLDQLGGKIRLVIDAGPAAVGIESTVVDLTTGKPRVLRPGMISEKEIHQALGLPGKRSQEEHREQLFKSPGLQSRHYSPKARLTIRKWKTEDDLELQVKATRVVPPDIHIIAYDVIPQRSRFGRVSVIPHDPEAYARALYAELHRADENRAQLIIVEEVPAGPEWEGIRDRLRRASEK
jgi:L-threonylcarbamoyladenylate synthase